MQASGHAFLHQRMIGGMELHKVGAPARGINDMQAGRVFIGEPPKPDCFGRTKILAESR